MLVKTRFQCLTVNNAHLVPLYILLLYYRHCGRTPAR